MNPGMPADDVIDLLAVIEMHRQEMTKESGLAAACDEALRMGGDASRRAGAGNPRSARRQVSLQSVARNFPRNKGRRTLGRGER